MSIYIGIDPSLTNTGIVLVNDQCDIPMWNMTIKTKPHGKGREGLFRRWDFINDELYAIPKHEDMVGLVYAPHYQHGKNKNATHLPLINGLCFAALRNICVSLIWREDKPLREALRSVGIAVPKEKSKIKGFVRNYWPRCPNEHEAMAYLAIKYLQVTSQ